MYDKKYKERRSLKFICSNVVFIVKFILAKQLIKTHKGCIISCTPMQFVVRLKHINNELNLSKEMSHTVIT